MIKNREFKNASWIIACKIVQSVLALVINMFTARYLGPGNYGTIHYAASLVSFVVPIMQLGLNSILVQEIVHRPKQEGTILGTAILLSMGSSVLCIAGVVSFVCIVNAGETETILVCALYSVLLVFQSMELIQYWFQAKLLSKYTSIVMLVAYIVVSTYRAILLITAQSIYWFALTSALDYMLIAGILLILYCKLGQTRLRFSWSMAKILLSKGRYFILSSLMITIFSQTDRIMLKLMVNEESTGFYSAAVSCALLTNFVFTAILDSGRPSIFEQKKKGNHQAYEKRITLLFSIITYISLLQCVFMTLLSGIIVKILYGNDFTQSADILQVAVWYTTFSYIGAVRSIWILAEGQQKYIWIINLSGALLNVALNFVLIPIQGAIGAAIASLVTQFITNIVLTQVIPSMRRCNLLLAKGLNPSYLIEAMRALVNKE